MEHPTPSTSMFARLARRFVAPFLVLQAVATGIILMHSAQVPFSVIATQAGTALLSVLLFFLATGTVRRIPHQNLIFCVPFVACALWGVAFFGCDLSGMHRWFCVGPFRIHVFAVLLPSFLVALSRPFVLYDLRLKCLLFMSASIALFSVAWCSDLSYTAALTAGLVTSAVLQRQKWSFFYWIVFGISALCLAFYRDISLPPVLHTEGILSVAWSRSTPMGVFAVISLLVANGAPFALWKNFSSRSARIQLISLFLFFAVVTLFGFTGVWPVPFLGFGAGPILGLALALSLIVLQDSPPHRAGHPVIRDGAAHLLSTEM